MNVVSSSKLWAALAHQYKQRAAISNLLDCHKDREAILGITSALNFLCLFILLQCTLNDVLNWYWLSYNLNVGIFVGFNMCRENFIFIQAE